jgi:hypothetical protein
MRFSEFRELGKISTNLNCNLGNILRIENMICNLFEFLRILSIIQSKF